MILPALLLVGAAACGGGQVSEAPGQQFHSLSVDDADFNLRLESVSIGADYAQEFHSQYAAARAIKSTYGFVATDGPGYVLQRGASTGAINPADSASTGSTTLEWERAPFEGILVRSDSSMLAAESAAYEVGTDLDAPGCVTVTSWDLWKLEPAPDQMLGQIELRQPTTATLETTIIIESEGCP